MSNQVTTPKASKTQTATCACGATHEVPEIRVFGRLMPANSLCPECLAKQDAETAQQAECEHTEQLESAWESICPPLYRVTDPNRLPCDPSQLSKVTGWEYGPKGLLLIGPSGTGKTRAVFLLLAKLLEAGKRIEAFDCADFGHDIQQKFTDGTGVDWVRHLARADVVFLDDVGKNPFTERVEAELFALIERRTANMLPIIATSNMTGAGLTAKASADRGGPMVRRLREFCEVIVFEDVRRK